MPLILASTLIGIVATAAALGLAGYLATEPCVSGWHGWLSRCVRRSCLMPLGFVAFTIVSAGQLQGQGTGVPSLTVQEFPQGGHMTEDMVTRIVTQGGAVAVLLVVLWSYRRDFFRKDEGKDKEIKALRDDRDTLLEVLDRATTAITNSVNATANQTTATHRLTQAVSSIERKMNQRRQGDDPT